MATPARIPTREVLALATKLRRLSEAVPGKINRRQEIVAAMHNAAATLVVLTAELDLLRATMRRLENPPEK